MIKEVKSVMLSCDNCGDTYINDHSGFSIFLDEGNVTEEARDDDWYVDGSDPEHQGKHYCPLCFKYHPEDDDKIIINLTRNSQP